MASRFPGLVGSSWRSAAGFAVVTTDSANVTGTGATSQEILIPL
jgi:hypothetical protein